MELLHNIHDQLAKLVSALEQLKTVESPAVGAYVDSAWVKEHFNISSSTLSDYRRKGIIPYTFFEERGKIYYRVSDLYRILEENFSLPLA